ncbi:unnamed protein product [Strongylus vulgaris]|uniref:Uncharacterized protein n=1 Tax=Strongylus vulgaris TaxID=40348 RepID=A0A3P7J5G8_STRVU|nr:unnamed protein product [Strongylus vulgaris]
MKTSRLAKCKKTKILTRRDKLNRLFTDEKIFTVEPLRNAQNQRELRLEGTQRVVKTEKTHLLQPKLGSGHVQKGVKINGKTYREQILEATVIP